MSQNRLIGCPLEWFTWAFGLTKSKEQFALALYLYRRACIVRGAMVTVPNRELTELGFGGRTSKRRLLLGLEERRRYSRRATEREGGTRYPITLALMHPRECIS